MYNPVSEIGSVDLPGLWPGGHETGGGPGRPGAGVDLLLQIQQPVAPAGVEVELIGARHLLPARCLPCSMEVAQRDLLRFPCTLKLTRGTAHGAHAVVVVAVVDVGIAIVEVDDPGVVPAILQPIRAGQYRIARTRHR